MIDYNKPLKKTTIGYIWGNNPAGYKVRIITP